jgi:hypothetical protein
MAEKNEYRMTLDEWRTLHKLTGHKEFVDWCHTIRKDIGEGGGPALCIDRCFVWQIDGECLHGCPTVLATAEMI